MNKKTLCLLTLTFTITACSGKSAEQLYSEGVQQLQKADPGGAIVLLKSALEKDQSNIEARFQLVKAYEAAGKAEQAEKECQKVLRLNPSRQEIKLELAKIHCSLRKYDSSIQEAREYLGSHAGSAEALEVLAIAHRGANNPDEAERCLIQALKAEPSRTSAKLVLAEVCGIQGRKQEARGLLKDVIAKDPKNSGAHYMLASLEVADGNSDKALQIYRQLADMNRSDPQALYRSGNIYVEKGDMERAAKTAEDLIARFPKSAEGYRLKGLVSYHRKNYIDAIAELQRSLKIQPDPQGIYFLGLSLYSKGDLENALSQFRLLLDYDPSLIQPRLLTGMILLSQKRIDDSISEINKLLKVDGKNALAHNLLGSAYLAKGMHDEGMRELDRATELDPKLVDAHVKKGLFHLNKGNSQAAELDLHTAVKVRPELLNTRLVLFSHYMKRNETGKALATLRDGLTGRTSDAVLYNGMAAVMFSEKKEAEAIKYLGKAKTADPLFLAAYMNLASFYTAAGKYDEALLEYGAVLQKDPKNLKAMLNTAALMEVKGKNAEALSWYAKAKETKDPAAYIALAGYHAKKNDMGKALAVLDEASNSIKSNTSILEMKGRICMIQKKYKEAIKAFEDIEAIDADKGMALKIKAYVAMKEIPKAEEQARRMIAKKPGSAQGYMVLAAIFENRNDLDRGIEELKNSLKVVKDNAPVMLMLGNLYAKKKDYGLASTTFEEVVRKYPNLPAGYVSQGTLLEMTGKKQEAVRKYRQALAKSGDYVPALNNLAYLSLEGYGDKAEGLRMATAALKLDPNNGKIMDTLGCLLLKNGQKEEACKVLERASTILLADPTVTYHLALAYRESGNKGQAAAKLRSALQAGPFPEEQNARKILAELK